MAEAPAAAQQILTQTDGGAHGVLVTAVSPSALAQMLRIVRRVRLVGLRPAGEGMRARVCRWCPQGRFLPNEVARKGKYAIVLDDYSKARRGGHPMIPDRAEPTRP